MKNIYSPCNCKLKVKRNGEGCKHAHLSDNVKEKVSILDRDDGRTSDSEGMIHNSNVRILKRGSTTPSSVNDLEQLRHQESEVLKSIGKAVGFDMEGLDEQVSKVVAMIGDRFIQ